MSLPATDSLIAGTTELITTYSAHWTLLVGSNSYEVSTSGGIANSAATFSGAYWNADVFPNDQYAQCVINVAGSSGNFNGICVRASTTGGANGYCVYVSKTGGQYAVFKEVAGVVTTLSGTTSHAFALNDLLYLSIVGTTLTFKQNGTTLYTTTDSSLTSGAAGVIGYSASSDYITSWQGGAYVAGGGVMNGQQMMMGVGSVDKFGHDSGYREAIRQAQRRRRFFKACRNGTLKQAA